MKECDYRKITESKIEEIRDKYLPIFYQNHKQSLPDEHYVLQSVCKEWLFGLIEVDTRVPDHWDTSLYREEMVGATPFTHELSPTEYFSEMSPYCTGLRCTETNAKYRNCNIIGHFKKSCRTSKHNE